MRRPLPGSSQAPGVGQGWRHLAYERVWESNQQRVDGLLGGRKEREHSRDALQNRTSLSSWKCSIRWYGATPHYSATIPRPSSKRRRLWLNRVSMESGEDHNLKEPREKTRLRENAALKARSRRDLREVAGMALFTLKTFRISLR